tara:strand:+ start:4121 stop:4684 length:564 start_codon:yes stop_codon:yes gene_type:complete
MSFEHKYLKYKQKYLELKNQLESMQQNGGASKNDDILDLDKLSDTPTFNNKHVNQLAGYLEDTSEYFKNSETDTDIENINELTETPKQNTMVVNIDSSTNESNEEEEIDDTGDKPETDNPVDSEDDSSSDNEDSKQNGGELETSISELDEIFSQLGGKKKKDKDSSSENSSLSSLSSLEDSSSDFDF